MSTELRPQSYEGTGESYLPEPAADLKGFLEERYLSRYSTRLAYNGVWNGSI